MSDLESLVVAPQFVLDLLQGASKHKLDIDSLIGDIISYSDLLDVTNETRITLGQYAEIARRLMSALDDEFLGLLKEPIPRRSFAAWCYAINGCKNLPELIEYSNLFVSLFTDQIRWSCKEVESDRVMMSLHFEQSEGVCSRFMVMSLMLIPFRVFGWFINENIKVENVAFSFKELCNDRVNIEHLTGASLEFGAQGNYFIFDKRYIDENVISNHQQIRHFLKDTRSQLLLRQITAPFSHKARIEIKQNFRETGEWLSLTELSERLGMESSKVKQKLKSEGSSYRLQLNEEKEKMAKHCLYRSVSQKNTNQ